LDLKTAVGVYDAVAQLFGVVALVFGCLGDEFLQFWFILYEYNTDESPVECPRYEPVYYFFNIFLFVPYAFPVHVEDGLY
jgi:hypothetical protein